MSVNSNRITIYSSPQVEHQKAGETDATKSLSTSRVTKRTTYRVKISNSKDLEALSTAAKLGVTSWVGGQRVRIVGVAPKQFSECATTESPVSSPADYEHFSGSLKARFAPQQAVYQNGSVTNGIYSSAFGKPKLHPGYSVLSAVEPNSESCTLSSFNDNHCERVVTRSLPQLCMTGGGQSPPVSGHCQPSSCLKTSRDTEMSLRHCRNGSLNSMKAWPQCNSTVPLPMLHGLPHRVRYVGTFAIDSQNNISVNSAVEVSRPDVCSRDVTDTAVVSVVKRFTESMNENKLSNGKKWTAPTIGCVKNNHVHTAYNTHSQLLNHSQNTLTTSARCLKRPFPEDDMTRVISAKRIGHSVLCSTEASKISHVTSSGTHCQDVTSNMLNCVSTRPGNCDQHAAWRSNQYAAWHSDQHASGHSDQHAAWHSVCSLNNAVKNCQSTVEVNNNCSSQQNLLSNMVSKLRLPSGSSMLSFILRCLFILKYIQVFLYHFCTNTEMFKW